MTPQSVKDALADAATLRRFRAARLIYLCVAARCAKAALCAPDKWVAYNAREAARAAFRAVPGLRGDR